MTERRVGFTPVPPDADLNKFFTELAYDHHEHLISILEELRETMVQTQSVGEPNMFAYGKMLNKLATLSTPELIQYLSAALWELA